MAGPVAERSACAWNLGRARHTVEPPILELGTTRLLRGDSNACLSVEDRVRNGLGQASRRLGDADWLDAARIRRGLGVLGRAGVCWTNIQNSSPPMWPAASAARLQRAFDTPQLAVDTTGRTARPCDSVIRFHFSVIGFRHSLTAPSGGYEHQEPGNWPRRPPFQTLKIHSVPNSDAQAPAW